MITRQVRILGGSPCSNGRRISVHNIVMGVHFSSSVLEYMAWMDIKLADIIEAVQYCVSLKCQNDNSAVYSFCEKCILQTMKNNSDAPELEEFNTGLFAFTKVGSENHIFLGTAEEYEEETRGNAGWYFAALAIEKIRKEIPETEKFFK